MSFLDELQQRILVGDGAMGTELRAAGAPADACLEALSLRQPAIVERVHTSYLAAGARLIRTNTFEANAVRLARHGLERQVHGINWTAAQLARDCAQAAGAHAAGSVGPLGLTAAEATAQGIDREAVFLEQIGALLDGGVRVIFLETFTDPEELAVALYAKHSLHHCPVIASLACGADGRLFDGRSLAEAFMLLQTAEADVVGVNCTAVSPALRAALASLPPDLPLAIFPNAGLPETLADGALRYPVTPAAFAAQTTALAADGARLIGGCCGTTPAHIAALAGTFAVPSETASSR